LSNDAYTALKALRTSLSFILSASLDKDKGTWEKRIGHLIVEFSLTNRKRSSFLQMKAGKMIAGGRTS
jgi:aspartate/tyrosine/aromatic aminotransferase